VGAAVEVCREDLAMGPEEGPDLLVEATWVAAAALGRLVVQPSGQPLPRVPAAAFAPIAAHAAEDALSRFDTGAAVRAWDAILAQSPTAEEARPAAAALVAVFERSGAADKAAALRARFPGPLPKAPVLPPVVGSDVARKRDLEARLKGLARECAYTLLADDKEEEVPLSVEARGAGPAEVKAGTASSPALARCLSARGPAYFVDAPADLKATLALMVGF
jgi:hypothetical protein